MSNISFGRKKWAFSDGYIPVQSTGREPLFVSSDKLSVLNTSSEDAIIKITIYFTDGEPPVGEFKLEVKSKRVRKFRINDLIDPQAIPLGVQYAGTIESNVPVVVQFTKQNTAQCKLALMGTMAYPLE